jgi:hypothetical protein
MNGSEPRVVLYGASNGGKIALSLCKDFEILAFADSDKSKQGREICGIKVINPLVIAEFHYDYIIITSSFQKAIFDYLTDQLAVHPKRIVFLAPDLMSRQRSNSTIATHLRLCRYSNSFREPEENLQPSGLLHVPDYFLFFAHIPKTGGTSFRRLLEQNYGPHFYASNEIIHRKWRQDEVLDMLKTYRSFYAFASHDFTLDLPFMFEGKMVHVVAFVRNPIECFLSRYYYARSSLSSSTGLEKTLDIADYIEEKKRQGDPFVNSLWHLSNECDKEKGLEKVHKWLELGQLHLYPSEKLSESCKLLKRRFPDTIVNESVGRELVSPKPTVPLNPALKKQIAKSIDASEFEFYRIALNHFENELAVTKHETKPGLG